jgi:hypothetical protein
MDVFTCTHDAYMCVPTETKMPQKVMKSTHHVVSTMYLQSKYYIKVNSGSKITDKT